MGGHRPCLSSSGGFLLPSKSPAAHSVQCIDWFHRAPCRSGLAGNWGGGTGKGAQKLKDALASANEPGAPHTRGTSSLKGTTQDKGPGAKGWSWPGRATMWGWSAGGRWGDPVTEWGWGSMPKGADRTAQDAPGDEDPARGTLSSSVSA